MLIVYFYCGKKIMEQKMVRKLKVDKTFSPCAVEENDELFPNGIFEFNITKMLEWVEKNIDAVILEEIEVCESFKSFSSLNESHIDNVDISRPVILAEIAPDLYNLIDGNHRMEKARRMKLKSIPAYKFNAKQHIRFLTSQRAYL